MPEVSPRLWALRTAFRTVGTVAPGVAARWAETIFCTPPRHEVPDAEEEFIATGKAVHRALGAGGAGGVGVGSRADGGAGARLGEPRRPADRPGEERCGRRVQGRRVRRAGAWALDRTIRLAAGVRAGAPRGGRRHGAGLRSGRATRSAVRRRHSRCATGSRRTGPCSLAPPADVVVFSHAFADHVGLPARAHATMRRNLETRLRMRWDDHPHPDARAAAPGTGARGARPGGPRRALRRTRRRSCARGPRRGS